MKAATPEFSRTVRIGTLSARPRRMTIEADEAERAALARRFGLVAIDALAAEAELVRKGATVEASGRVRAAVTQSCVATGKSIEVAVDEAFRINFVPPPEADRADEEVELSAADCDTSFYAGGSVDIGEAAAETLSLALDPWPRAPDAEEALKAAGVKSEAEAGPFAGLAALRDKLEDPGR